MPTLAYLKHFPVIALCALALALPGQAAAGVADCGELKNFEDIGPWDYADPSSSAPTGENPMGRIKRVENVHFNPSMRNLDLRRYKVDRLTAEIHYTLRVFPNHPWALNSLSRLEKMNGGKLPQNSVTAFTPRITADCFFDRALRFRPDDKAVHLVYGLHLHQRGKIKEALEHYELSEKLGEDSANLHYNLGLAYAEVKNWDKAAKHGQLAYDAGLTLPALREKLEKAGYKLTQPVPKPVAETAAEASPATATPQAAAAQPPETAR